jgi:hypothetical protein
MSDLEINPRNTGKVDRFRLTFQQLVEAAVAGKTVYVASYNFREREWVQRELMHALEEKDILAVATKGLLKFPSGGRIIFAVADQRGNDWARGITFYGGVGYFDEQHRIHLESE